MTADDSAGTDDPGEVAEETPDAAADRIEALESTVAELADRVEELEHAVAWLARQQAAETGNSVCPACNTGGSLAVTRTPTGKKQVECRNCGEKLN